MKIVFLDFATMGEGVDTSVFEEFGEITVYDTTPTDRISERIKDADIVLANKCRLNRETLKGADKLRLICVAATGYDNIDIPYCRENKIAVTNVVGYSTDSVALLTVSLVLERMLHLSYQENYVRNGEYSRSGVANHLMPSFHELRGLTWGIVGAGNIGHAVARVAEAFGCRVVVNRRHKDPIYETLPLEELLSVSDIVTIHTPLNEETRGLIGEKEIALMKPDAILVNVARGAVTDEEAVKNAVLSGKLKGFATDVYSKEPLPEDHPIAAIKDHPAVSLTPHMAWGSVEARKRCLTEMAENIRAFQRNELRNRVDVSA